MSILPHIPVKIRQILEDLFLAPADGRVYACVRIAFSLTALTNLVMLWPDRGFLLTDAGMINQEITRQTYLWPYLTVFDWCRDAGSVSMVMVVSSIALVFLLLGKMQRVAALVVYVWHVSYAARAVNALCGWDIVLRCVSFLILCSPLPAVWSLDKPHKDAPTIRFYGLTLMRFQLLVIYWQTVLDRLDSPFWLKGEFMGYYVLSHFARWPAVWLLDFELLLRVVTYLILIVEVALPLLLYSQRWHRTGMVAGFLLHFGIFLTSNNLFMFFLSMMVLYAAFLHTADIDSMTRLAKRLLRTRDPLQTSPGKKRKSNSLAAPFSESKHQGD